MPINSRYAKLPLTLLALAVLAGCDASSSGGGSKSPPGYPDVQATAAGTPVCYQTDPGQNHAAAQATSAARRAHGLPAVRPDPALAKAAADHACDMAARGLMSHVGSTTKGPMQRAKAQGYVPHLTAENIAAGPFSQQRVLNEWSASSGHMANITIPQVRDVGIGRALAADGRTVFWAAVYGAPR